MLVIFNIDIYINSCEEIQLKFRLYDQWGYGDGRIFSSHTESDCAHTPE
jgi:hypothetical protein